MGGRATGCDGIGATILGCVSPSIGTIISFAREKEMIVPMEGLTQPRIVAPIPSQPVALPPMQIVQSASEGPLQIQPIAHTPVEPSVVPLRVTRTVNLAD